MFYYLLHLANLLVGITIFTTLMATTPSYAAKMVKVEAASGLSMPMVVYVAGPTALLLSALAKLVYHATSETWKMVGSKEKRSGQNLQIPKPKSKILLRKITIPEAEAETPFIEYSEILETIRNK